jgi:hypothetical protein
MDVFDLRNRLVRDYGSYTRSFIRIADGRINAKVDGELDGGALWPEPLLQLNPTFLPGGTIDALVDEGTLHPKCKRIFRIDKSEHDPVGRPLQLHTHQAQAIRKAREDKSYVLTSGTGSGKSLTYIVPIVDHVLRNGTGRGIQAIVVYPMNALANSQAEELSKFLERGYAAGQSPVRFKRYTGQEKTEEREEIRRNPPDVLLTNYMMLELMLTRRDDRALVAAAHGIKFLVFDELHTYRGRQGADVALLIRRCRLAFGGHDFVCVGTSATMSSEGNSIEQKRAVARVAQTLFGTNVDESQVIGESLRRSTPELDWPQVAADRQKIVTAVAETTEPPADYADFRTHPIASWIESTFGVRSEEGTGRLIRQTPRRLRGEGGAADELAELASCSVDRAHDLLQQFLLKGAALHPPESSRFPIFAFRLHQFFTRGDTIWSTIEAEHERHLEFAKLVSKPGEPTKPLFPLVFCQQCGCAYYRVMEHGAERARHLVPREDRREDGEGGRPGYLYLSAALPWPSGEGPAVVARVPQFFKEQAPDGGERLLRDAKKDLPETVHVNAAGNIVPEGDGVAAALIHDNFLFCLKCGVAYAKTQRSERAKLATLGVDNRSTATTILAVRTLLELQEERSLTPEARKLLSFTDNRQDASLQAGHFNDFTQVALLRSALYKAATAKGSEGLTHADLSRAVFEALALKFDDYAADPDVRGPARTATEDALRRVLQYFLYRDLQRLWRVTAPNLEDCGLLRFGYHGLDGQDGLLAEEELWSAGFDKKEARATVRVDAPDAIRLCPPALRAEITTTLLDVLRRNLAVKVDVLDPLRHRDLVDQTQPRLQENTVWYLDELKELVAAEVAYPRAKPREGRGDGLFISSYGSFGRYLKRRLAPHLPTGQVFGRVEVDAAIAFLFRALQRYGLVEQVRGADTPGYQLNPEALRWIASDGVERGVDRTRLLDAGEVPPQVNDYFVRCYRTFVELRARLEAHEHTAQVSSEEREEREDRFRTGDLPLLFCSPTMELGVDIAQLNVVNLRNVPPTPANYAQRSGRAGRGGQPALVYTYCAGRSPHDQYFFRDPELMVAGSVAPPRIDLRNSDLVRSHVHALWMQVAKPDFGKTLTAVIDVQHEGGRIDLPLKAEISRELGNTVHRGAARELADRLMLGIQDQLAGAPWFHPDWTRDTLEQLELSFEAACERWRSLYRSAVRQRELHHKIIVDHARPDAERNHSRRLRAQAESQIKLLTEAQGVFEGDFYSYRYFAAEGFLPGYNFPRLPLSAYLPGRGRNKGRDEFISRPRFLAISEFGPRALIYHEGARYRVYKVNLDYGAGPADDDVAALPTGVMKRCLRCGYGHFEQGVNLTEVCERCNSALEGTAVIQDMVQLQNVSLKLAQRITCDEEERQRFGYKLVTAYRFPEIGGRMDRRDAEVFVDGSRVMQLSYGDATSLYRVNLGWKHQKGAQTPGFMLDLERGYWATNAVDQDDVADGAQGRQMRVVPYVMDTKNALVMRFDVAQTMGQMASLQAALKEAIQQHFQLEPRELAAEPMPTAADRAELLFYESAEGGAGVLRQLVEDPGVMARLARRALAVCHFAPDTLGDEAKDTCGKACYRCLLDYGNQPDHQLLDRFGIQGILAELAQSETKPAGGVGNRAERIADLKRQCDSQLERRWLDMIEQLVLTPPSDAQFLIEAASTQPDFYYREFNAAVYIDGPPHDTPDAIRNDERISRDLKALGYIVVRFHHGADWQQVFAAHPDIFGRAAR